MHVWKVGSITLSTAVCSRRNEYVVIERHIVWTCRLNKCIKCLFRQWRMHVPKLNVFTTFYYSCCFSREESYRWLLRDTSCGYVDSLRNICVLYCQLNLTFTFDILIPRSLQYLENNENEMESTLTLLLIENDCNEEWTGSIRRGMENGQMTISDIIFIWL